MEDSYNFKQAEEKIKKFWDKEKIFSWNKNKKGKIYSVDTPPPYISGKMHIGHAFSYAQQDFVIRYRRMKGFNVYYPFGTDDNGLPTERFIEKINNVKSKDVGRAEFIDLCLKTLKKITPDCLQDFINLGISSDYSLYYSTIDKYSQKISQKSFIQLVKQGDIYRKEFPTIWCPECQTSIAQAELEDKETSSLFSTLKFKVQETKSFLSDQKSKGGKISDTDGEDLLISTTRPELLASCVAVFVNPKDKRYTKLIGKKAKVPLFNFEVPIIEDESAEIEKGTGVLMVCSYGDRFDIDAINRHALKPRVTLEKDGTLNVKGYERLIVKSARDKILKDLEENNLIADKKQITHVLNVHDKCGTEIEFIPTEQWFVKILDKKNKFINQGEKINWYPDFMSKRYNNWVRGLEWDWNISRNRYFGVPIPVWYCKNCNEVILAEEKDLPVDPLQIKKKCTKCKKDAEPEKMVLDTWFTSSLTPQLAAELPQVKGKIKLPFSLRPQGHDIIRTWAFYTIVKSYLHEKKIPWIDIAVSGNVSLGGEKMSKSKGNVIEPQEVMASYGSDSLRFWAGGSKLGTDLDYSEKDVLAGKKFLIKLFNASRFIFMNLKQVNKIRKPKKLEEVDRLFLVKLNEIIKNSTASFDKYEYSRCKNSVVDFFWSVFCDNYLELVKHRIYSGSRKEKESAFYTLYSSLFTILKLMAPFTPFITEYLYQKYFKKQENEKSIHLTSWPEEFKIAERKDDKRKFDLLLEIISKIRQVKSENKKSVKAEIILSLEKDKLEKLKNLLGDLKAVVNAREIKEGEFRVEFL